MSNKKSDLHFYADECIPIPTVTHLKEKGISIRHAFDDNFINKADELHFKKARRLKRVLLSLDKDFRKFINADMANHPGVVLITSGNNTPIHLNEILDKFLKNTKSEFVKHSIVRITIDKKSKDKAGVILASIYKK